MSPPFAQWTNFSLSVHVEFASLVELILNNQAPGEQCGKRIPIYQQQQYSMALKHKDYLGIPERSSQPQYLPCLYISFLICEESNS